ncbi:hypothetical protein VTK73DRAFT_7911 [Phialemonium thermophilum]|uniref:Uncharacterized protein n=1 Tax=Phialemonium thermophilum TaxID=223376 RepID=A0ABR3WC26_9PEZI
MLLSPEGVAFVTGAGGAVGRATVLQFARDGVVKMAGLDIAEPGLQETARLLKEVSPAARFLPLVADLTDGDQVRKAFQTVVDQFGRVDYAVNNAGIGAPHALTADAADADFDRVLGVNVRGVWNCERLELEQMAKQTPLPPVGGGVPGRVPSRGAIVNVDSVLGLLAMPKIALYTMSKHCVLGLTKTDALDYARLGVRVNAVCPGFIDTPLLTEEARNVLAPSIAKTAMGRLANAQEIADAIIYLCSERSSYMTGVSLAINVLRFFTLHMNRDGGRHFDDLRPASWIPFSSRRV